MRIRPTWIALVLVTSAVAVSAQSGPAVSSAQPFKLGTFEIEGEERLGIVLQDKLIVELEAANRALERNRAYPRLTDARQHAESDWTV